MTKRFDLDEIAEAEAFGALAVGKTHRRTNGQAVKPICTRTKLQHLLSFQHMLTHLLQLAREVGADRHPIKTRSFSVSLDHSKDLKVRVLKKRFGRF